MRHYNADIVGNNNLSGSFGNTIQDSRFTGSFSGSFASPGLTVVTNSSYTISVGDLKRTLIFLSGSGIQQLIIPLSTTMSANINDHIDIIQSGSAQVEIISGSTSVIINSANGLFTRAQYSVASAVNVGTDKWIVFGDISI